MNGNAPPPASPDDVAARIADAFDAYREQFAAVTRRAALHFAARDWPAARADAVLRLALGRGAVATPVAAVRGWLAAHPERRAAWPEVMRRFRDLRTARDDAELGETFFNSVARRALDVVGVDRGVEFTERTPLALRSRDESRVMHVLHAEPGASAATLVARVLAAYGELPAFADAMADAELAGAAIEREVGAGRGAVELLRAEMLRPVFYRNKGAYLVGRLVTAAGAHPLLLALVHGSAGVQVDAVLTTSDEASIVFGFSRSYFQADVECPAAVVSVLASLMPLKRVDELYTSVGFNKHGKRELYRQLLRHLARAEARFERAEGDEGLVMTVFTLPSFNVVFKVIKDRFGEPKRTTREEVRAKYEFVFVRDRAGRLADAQEFEYLELPADRFAPALLDHLRATCGDTVQVEQGVLRLRHCYTERRVVPLNLHLRAAGSAERRRSVLDYGRAIKELACTNIFTGDMLLKNFGVSRHGRVICYDYDELGLLTDCVVRRIPAPADHYEEMSAEPYFSVGEHDIFPEEFGAFLVPGGELRDVFLAEHADLLTVEFWQGVQARIRAGELADIFPYDAERRLRPG